jgi:pimeloyl-ACP methyl ester carboxylesterase
MHLTATLPRRAHFPSLSAHGFHRVNYWEWGDADNPRVAVCVHGLARNGRDFDVLAEALSATHRVLAVDMPGRGDSEWLADPGDYGFPTYLAERVDWIGTSMGGLLGMAIAAQPGAPVTRLVVNDVGPVIESEALARIATYVGLDPTFASFADIEGYIRAVSAPFGALTDSQWTFLTETNVRRRADGRWGLAYDPGIAVPFRANPAPADLWGLWDAIRCPTLVLRGANSDLLSAATAAAMKDRGPRPDVIEFAGVGHAPMLLDPCQIAPVVAFLATPAGTGGT